MIWWRRSRADQLAAASYNDRAAADLLNQDWRGALRGGLLSRYDGPWVSRPDATDNAGFKLVQLDVAAKCGFKVPETLVSNDPFAIREFVGRSPEGAIIKAVAGTRHTLLVTHRVRGNDLPDDEILRVAPSIWQEYIPGRAHIRLNQFGPFTYPFLIESEKLDWRPQLKNSITAATIDEEIASCCNRMLDFLGIEMGIFDLKYADSGDLYFFEVNPQGQFLFLEGITGFPIGEKFADFLASRVRGA